MSASRGNSALFYKLAVLIACVGAIACGLLTLRQARLQAANEYAEARLRIRALNERVSAIRATLASEITPDRVEEMASEIGLTVHGWRDELGLGPLSNEDLLVQEPTE